MIPSPRRSPSRHIDPARLDRDPYPILHALRNEAPVAWVEPAGMWFVTRHADVIDVLRDPVRFTTDSPGSTIRDTFSSQMLSAEGEEQRRYKTACAGPFTTRAVREQAGPTVERIVTRLLDRVGLAQAPPDPAGSDAEHGDRSRRGKEGAAVE